MRRKHLLALLLVAVTTHVGCKSSIGPKTIPRDQFDYAEALRDSSKEQMLLNMVGLRYAEAPLFLRVTSVINQYSLEGSASLAAPPYELQAAAAPPAGIRGRYADRPTITYAPLTGADFTRSVLTPIPPATIMSMIQAGWRADLLLRVTVRSINGVTATRDLAGERIDSRFFEIVSILRKLQDSGSFSFRVEKRSKNDVALIVLRGHADPELKKESERLAEILGIDRSVTEYRLVFGQQSTAGNEIAMITRSILEMLVSLALWVDVPAEHIQSGRTMPTSTGEGMEEYGFHPLIVVHSSPEPPTEAFVAVRYDNIWFWIDHEDFRSKRTLTFMQLMFSLAESGGGQQKPVVTVQAGGG